MANIISNCSYTTDMFNSDKFVKDIMDKYKITSILENLDDYSKSSEFVNFIGNFYTAIHLRYKQYENSFKTFNEKLEKSVSELNTTYIAEFHIHNSRIKVLEEKLKTVQKDLKDNNSILITFNDNKLSVIKELDNNKKTHNDQSVRDMLVNKLKSIEQHSLKYETHKKELQSEIHVLMESITELEKKRYESCAKYQRCSSLIDYNNNCLFDAVQAMDKLYRDDITSFMKFYNLLITDYINVSELCELINILITKIKKYSDKYELELNLSSLKSAFLECGYTESELVNSTTYVSTDGMTMYTTKKLQPAFTVKLKSFRLIHYLTDIIDNLDTVYDSIVVYKTAIAENKDNEHKTLYNKIVPRIYGMSLLLFELLYGHYGHVTKSLLFRGISFERGAVSKKLYISKFQQIVHNYVNGKEKNKQDYSKIYYTIINTFYTTIAIKLSHDLDSSQNSTIFINKLKAFGANMETPDLYNKNLIHYKINKKS